MQAIVYQRSALKSAWGKCYLISNSTKSFPKVEVEEELEKDRGKYLPVFGEMYFYLTDKHVNIKYWTIHN